MILWLVLYSSIVCIDEKLGGGKGKELNIVVNFLSSIVLKLTTH